MGQGGDVIRFQAWQALLIPVIGGALLAACASEPEVPAGPLTADQAAQRIDEAGIACQPDGAINHVSVGNGLGWQQIECEDWSVFVGGPEEADRLLSTEDECDAQRTELAAEISDRPELASDTTIVAAVGPNWDVYYGDGSGFPWRDPVQATIGQEALRSVAEALGGRALTPVETMRYWLEYNGCDTADFP